MVGKKMPRSEWAEYQKKLAWLATDPKTWDYHYNDPEWYREVILEFPTGELAESGLKTLALLGRDAGRYPVSPVDITNDDSFNAQGLEGKVQLRMILRDALLKTGAGGVLPEGRWQIRYLRES